jgi:hypothetical protein
MTKHALPPRSGRRSEWRHGWFIARYRPVRWALVVKAVSVLAAALAEHGLAFAD